MTLQKSTLPKMIGFVETFRQINPEMPSQAVLAFLLVAESGPDGILQSDLGQRLGLSVAATSRNVLFLSALRGPGIPGYGLVDVEINVEHRSYRRIKLSPKGTKLLERLVKTVS